MKRWIAVLVLMFSLGTAVASAEITLGETEELILPERFLHAVYTLDDGGFFLSGQDSVMAENGYADALCMRIDKEGKEIWRVSSPAEGGMTWFMDEVLLEDGTIALLQQTEQAADTAYTLVMVREDAIIHSEAITPGDIQVWPEMFAGQDGFFLAYGERRQADALGGTFHVPALEYRKADGSLVWKHVFEEYEANLKDALPVEGGHILYGSTEEQKTGERYSEGFLAKVDAGGNILWVRTDRSEDERWRTYSGEGVLLANGDFVLAGGATLLAKEGEYPGFGLLAQFNSEGDFVWEEAYRPYDTEFFDVSCLTPIDSGYLLLGREGGYRLPTDIFRLDEQGKIVETTQKAWGQDYDVAWAFLENETGSLRLVARITPDVSAETAEVPRSLLITPIDIQ